jgi:hypothetical protein
MKKIILVEDAESAADWLAPFENLLQVIKNTFAQFLNVVSTTVKLIITIDEKEIYETIDKYYDRMKSINAKNAEVMSKIEQSSGDMNFFAFMYNPGGTLAARILTGGPGALRNFVDFYKDATGVSLNPFDIGPPGAKDSASLMNNRMNYAMGFNFGGGVGGGRGTAPSRVAKQLETRLNRAFGITPDPRLLRGPRAPLPSSVTRRVESFCGEGLPILVESSPVRDVTAPLTDAEFKKAAKHFLSQVDFKKLGIDSSAKKIADDMRNLAQEMSIKLSRPYDLIMKLSTVQDPKEIYEILNLMKAEGFVIQGIESLRPEKIQILVDETIEKAESEGKVKELIGMSSVNPKIAEEPSDEEIEIAAKEVVSKTVMSRTVSESKKQIEAALTKSKEGVLRKFDELFLPKNKEDMKLLMKSKFGDDFRSARQIIENSGIPIQIQVKLNTI